MPGLSNVQRLAILDSVYNQTLWLRLLKWTGVTSTDGINVTVNDDGSLPANLVEVTEFGCGPQQHLASEWDAAFVGPPTIKEIPHSGSLNQILFTASGGDIHNVCSYAWTTDANPITASNYVSSGAITHGNVAVVTDILNGRSIGWDGASTIMERLGDPPAGVNPFEPLPPPPNLVFILTDDEADTWLSGRQLDSRAWFKSEIAAKSVWFRNFRGSFNLCAPSRASVITGLNWWNHHIYNETNIDNFNNGVANGGWNQQWWADAWGTPNNRTYQVMHGGKVVNGWGKSAAAGGKLPVPPYMMVNSFDEFYGVYGDTINGVTYSEQSKSTYLAHEETFQADGTSNGYNTFFANYKGGTNPPQNLGDYLTDYLTTKSIGFLNNCASRSPNDPRHGLPFMLTLSPTNGHTPHQNPPIFNPDTTNRASRINYYNNYIRDTYDTRTVGNDLGMAPAAVNFSGTGFVTTGPYVTTDNTYANLNNPIVRDTTANWSTDEWMHFQVTVGSHFGVVIHNTATDLYIGEWLDVGSMDAHFSYTLSTSPPSSGTYTVTAYDPDVPNFDIGTKSSTLWSNQVGPPNTIASVGGEYSTNPGTIINAQRQTGQEMVGVDDMFKAIVDWGSARSDQYSADNTIYVYTSDNGIILGNKNIWSDKGFPPDSNFRIPLFIRWTGGGISQGVTNDFHFTTVDLYPTLLSLMSIPTSARSHPVSDGLDLSSALRGEAAYPTDRAFMFNGNGSTGTHGMITSLWRYYFDSSPPSGPTQYNSTGAAQGVPGEMIYHIKRDPLELRNCLNSAEVTTGGHGGLGVQGDLKTTLSTYYPRTVNNTPGVGFNATLSYA